MKPLIIGIPTNLEHVPTSNGNCKEVVFLNSDFYHSILKVKAIPICLPPLDSLTATRSQLELCDGLLLPGGDDVNPLSYNEEPSLHLGSSNTLVDTHQLTLTKLALDLDMPILGICRGHQLINISLGGSVYQDLSSCPHVTLQHMQSSRRYDLCHSISVLSSSKLHQILGSSLSINSFHHQAISKLGQNIIATAHSTDGIIEAIELTTHSFVIGVQWHPEIMLHTSSNMLPLFESFISSCDKYSKNKLE